MTLPSRSVCLYADGAQNPAQLERGIGRYVSEHARAINALAPSLLHSVLANPGLSLTGNLIPLLGKGLLQWSDGTLPAESRVGGVPRVYHIMSPFEATTAIDTMWPFWARDSRIATVVTLYDLIPLVFPDQYLHDPAMRAFYSARVQLIRQVDGILALSQHTAGDAVERLQISPDLVHVINAGTNEQFAAMYPSPTAAWAHISRNLKGVRRGFLLYVGGADFRKNLEGMIAGYGRMPPTLRARHQLVIANVLNPGQADLLRAEADCAGIEPGELVLTGHVTDADLGALYHACALFVFPSFYEGFGLPILEAMSCGAPVAASAATSVPEVLGDLEGTFQPHDPDSIASCLAGLLTSPELLDRLRARSARRVAEYTWQHVAEKSIDAYDRVATRTERRRVRRARLAFVTPWPPEQSRIADYNQRLVAELEAHVDVDVVVGHPVDIYPRPRERGVRLIYAGDFGRVRDLVQHDRILYCMGNSELHHHVYELLRRQAGLVVMHDVRLTGFYRWYGRYECLEDPELALAHRVRAMYGDRLPPNAAEVATLSSDREIALGVYMTRELQSYADRCLVHSGFDREVLELERAPSDRPVPVSVVPFGIPPPVADPRAFDAGSDPLIVSLGDITEVRGMATVIDAFALLAADMPRARLVVTGHAGEVAARESWYGNGGSEARNGRVDFLGEISADQYCELLQTADLAIQLRLLSDDQAPMLVADCLANGLPTIVSDLGWAGELPLQAVQKVPSDVSPHQLKDRIVRLLGDRAQLAALSHGALEHARSRSFATVADAYLDALDLV